MLIDVVFNSTLTSVIRSIISPYSNFLLPIIKIWHLVDNGETNGQKSIIHLSKFLMIRVDAEFISALTSIFQFYTERKINLTTVK